jgi:hypothetical protein
MAELIKDYLVRFRQRKSAEEVSQLKGQGLAKVKP